MSIIIKSRKILDWSLVSTLSGKSRVLGVIIRIFANPKVAHFRPKAISIQNAVDSAHKTITKCLQR